VISVAVFLCKPDALPADIQGSVCVSTALRGGINLLLN